MGNKAEMVHMSFSQMIAMKVSLEEGFCLRGKEKHKGVGGVKHASKECSSELCQKWKEKERENIGFWLKRKRNWKRKCQIKRKSDLNTQ